MSLKDLARELYRAQQQVEKYEKLFREASLGQEEEVRVLLEEARAEWRQIRSIVDGRKSAPIARRKY